MKRLGSMVVSTVVLSLSGCARITSQVVEKPRVDQELQGNQGYLQGTPPAPTMRKATRRVVQTDIELPTKEELNPWRKPKIAPESTASSKALALQSEPVPMESRPSMEPMEMEEPISPILPTQPMEWEEIQPKITTYTVKAGDTLEKIAAKVYGDSSQWRSIYETNRESLKSPNRIYPGQKLVIPPRREEERTQRADSQGDFK